MGGFSNQPYIYTPQTNQQRTVYPYSGFNPKAVTQEHEKKANAKPKPKQEGPLINFNQHPDSYEFGLQRQSTAKPMPARTKTEVAVVRWVQFALRILEEIGALGLLTCMICIRNMQSSVGWIVRISMGWDVVVTLYAIYHLIRPAKARPPASSASYHFFALFMDVCLIPFCIFLAFFSRENWLMESDVHDRWTTVFEESGNTDLVLHVVFLTSAVMAGLHLLSVILDIWLIVLFRKITSMPPDMNPLEDNLTSRKSSKHKYKNSELTLTDSMAERKSGYLSGSTLSVTEQSRLSTATKEVDNVRKLPFSHSRLGSEATFSPHNPDTARWSRQHYGEVDDMYQQSQSARSSRTGISNYSRPTSMTPWKDGSWVECSEVPPVPSLPIIHASSTRPISCPATCDPELGSGTKFASPARHSTPVLPNAAPSNALVKTQQTQGLLHDNWFAMDDDGSDVGTPPIKRKPLPTILLERHESFEHQPLKMNPPTPPPPPKKIAYPDPGEEEPYRLKPSDRNALTVRRDNGNGDLGRQLTVQSNATNSSSVYSESAPELKSSSPSSKSGGTPKGKYYGNLAAATRGVRGVTSNETFKSNGTVDAAEWDSTGFGALGSYGYRAPEPVARIQKTPKRAPKPPPKDTEIMKRDVTGGTVDAATMDSTGFGALGSYGYGAPEPPPKKSPARKDTGGNGRVVSRTGVDITDFATTYKSNNDGAGIRGRRDVSGKIAEEGRGGNAWMDWRRY